MSKNKLRVTGLELQTKDGKKVPLTLEEAKELHEQLDELFGKDITYVGPYYVNPQPWRPYYTWYSTSGNTNTITTCASSTTGMTLKYTSTAVAA